MISVTIPCVNLPFSVSSLADVYIYHTQYQLFCHAIIQVSSFHDWSNVRSCILHNKSPLGYRCATNLCRSLFSQMQLVVKFTLLVHFYIIFLDFSALISEQRSPEIWYGSAFKSTWLVRAGLRSRCRASGLALPKFWGMQLIESTLLFPFHFETEVLLSIFSELIIERPDVYAKGHDLLSVTNPYSCSR